jgi:hypothetical protein
MTSAQKLARFGATLALALTLTATTAPSLVFADEENTNHEENVSHDDNDAPLVISIVDGGIQTAAGATEFGLGTGAAASGEDGLGTATQGTGVGAAVTGAGLSIPAGIVGR